MMHVSIKKTSILSALALCACVLALPYIASAAEEFVTLAGIPGLESASGDKISMEGYLDNLYRIAIIAAALIAVIKLILAGAQYVLSGVVTDKEKAKTDIRSALIGLLIILAATTLLTTINPSLTNLKALEPAPFISAEILDSLPSGTDQTGNDYCYNLRANGDSCAALTCYRIKTTYPDASNCRSYCLDSLNGEWEGGSLSGTCYVSKYSLDSNVSHTKEIITCDTATTITCDEATKKCMSNPDYQTVQQTDENTIECFLEKSSLDGGETTIDPTQTYLIYTNGVSDGRTGTIINTSDNQTVDLMGADGNEYRNFPCTDLSPNPPGCVLPDSRKLIIQDGISYYTEYETTVGVARTELTFIEEYKTIDDYVQVQYTNGEEVLLPCNSIEPSVCN